MATDTMMGTITFINHDKDYATIEYLANGKKKTLNGNISEQEQLKLKAAKLIKKIHQFHVGDEVSFTPARSPRGDKMIADKIVFRFNNALDNLINKSAVENKFVGYLKKVDVDYFVKETGSYIFFPLILSPWEKKPAENSLNDPIFFSLNNTHNTDKITASLSRSNYIPEYMAALKYFKNKSVIDAVIYKITPHGIFVNVVGDKIQAKIPVEQTNKDHNEETEPTIGDTIKVIITYLSNSKIIVERYTTQRIN
ncbi:MAG: S1 RNA-binding domain-containing protein [Ferruginibacter sp.]